MYSHAFGPSHKVTTYGSFQEKENHLLKKSLSPTQNQRIKTQSDDRFMEATVKLLYQNEQLDEVIQKQAHVIKVLQKDNQNLTAKNINLQDELTFLKKNQENRILYLEKKIIELIKNNQRLSTQLE